MGCQYKVRSAFFGLMYKVVIFADSYERRVLSYHFSFNAAMERRDQLIKGDA